MAKTATAASKQNTLLKKRKALDAKKGSASTETAASTETTETPASTENTTETTCKLPEKLIGIKYVRLLEKQLHHLRDEDSQHGNRKLFMDDVFVVYLLAFFNPCVRSLRTLEDLSQTKQVQEHISIEKVCKSTLSDFNKLVDPERLQPTLAALREQLGRKLAGKPAEDRDLQTLLKHTVAVDGTFLPAVAEVAWAVANNNSHGTVRHRARLDARINVSTWMPEAIVIPDPGESEAACAIKHIQAGKIYIYDRGYSGFDLLAAHYHEKPVAEKGAAVKPRELKASFVVRYKPAGGNAPTLDEAVDRDLTAEDVAAGVVSDRVGYFTSDNARRAGLKGVKLREVIVEFQQDGEMKKLRLITNLHDVSALTIALLYQQRWQVELFFRWFKSFGNFGHLISHSSEGALAHLYVTIIGVLLMYLHTGYRPSKYMFAMLSQVAAGGATLEEIIPILRERERRKELDRQSAARRREKKKKS